MSVLDGLKPELLWKHFDEIRKIPHCSKHEEKIREYIIGFAKEQGLQYKTDKSGNIVIPKPATPGMENKPVVILQGHMDMVCEKNSDLVHDFLKDPLKLKRDGDILTADGTTLGADNGIGCSVGLALLQDTSIKHGPIEALFTVDEETGLTGAFAMEADMLTGKIMLNLDSEEFGVITVGCAGGGDTKIELPIKTQLVGKDLESVQVKVAGLRGGHSGVNINEQRGNAIKILARLLWKTMTEHQFYIAEMKGGDKHNAIPREAYAILLLKKTDKDKLISDLQAEEKAIFQEIKPIDPKFKLEFTSGENPKNVLNQASQMKLLNLLHGLPHGIHQMSYDIPGLVETSTNLATVSIGKDKAVIGMSSRSSIKSALQDMRDRIQAVATLSGAKAIEETPYPGWKPNLDSPILAQAKKVYKDMFGNDPKVEAVHAGLECGIIGEKFPGMDMISIGPTINFMHSPEEQVSISSVAKLYQYIGKILQRM